MPAPPPNLDLSRSQCPMPDALPRDALPIRFMIFKEVSLFFKVSADMEIKYRI